MTPATPEGAIDDLWRTFKETADKDARDRLVLHYAPLVKYVAGRVRSGLPDSVDQNDLVSDGVIGLMDAIEKFEPERNLQFQTYAIRRIRGAIIDGLRASDWVPRSVRSRIRDINAAQAELEERLGRAPTDGELAAALDMSVKELRGIFSDMSYTNVASIDALGLGDDGAPTPPSSPADRPDADDDIPAGFLDAVRQLPERDQIIVALYYWEGLTLSEIGQVLQVTESRVSQLHSRATVTLRRKLAEVS